MLLSNIQQNIGKAPMVGAAQSAAHKSQEVAKELKHSEELDKSRQAEEQVKELNKLENGEIDEKHEHEAAVDPDKHPRKNPQKRFASTENEDSESLENNDKPDTPSADHVIDIIA
ncbi:MAG: hypothetical protein ACYTFY_00030 [Planctomycetota bacterium]|jgi:hypothetical protein